MWPAPGVPWPIVSAGRPAAGRMTAATDRGAAAGAARLGASARDILLDAARDLMIETGSSDVSLHALARRAGVTAPLVKYYFGGKEGLLTALVDRALAAGQLAAIDRITERAGSGFFEQAPLLGARLALADADGPVPWPERAGYEHRSF